MRRIVLVVLGWCVSLASLAEAKDTLKVQSRERPGTSVTEIVAVATVAASAESLFAVITDLGNYPGTLPHVTRAEPLGREPSGAQHWYLALDLPVISDRDYAIRLEQAVEGQTRKMWWTPSDRAPPRRPGHVRITTNEGGWEVTPVEGENRAQVRYRVFVDPAGNIPRFLANQANRDAIPKLFEAVEDQAQRLDAKGKERK